MFDWLQDALGDVAGAIRGADTSGSVRIGDARTGAQITWGDRRYGWETVALVAVLVYLLAKRG